MWKGAIPLAADRGVLGKDFLNRKLAGFALCLRSDLAIDIGTHGLLYHSRGAEYAMVDGSVEMKNRKWRGQLPAFQRALIIVVVDRSNLLIGDALQCLDHLVLVCSVQLDLSPGSWGSQCDPFVNWPAGIVGVITATALEN